MICLTFGLFTQVSDSGPHGPLVTCELFRAFSCFSICIALHWGIMDSCADD